MINKFDSVWSKNLGKTQHTTPLVHPNPTLAMEQNLGNYDFGSKNSNVKILKKNTDNDIKSHKCKQCDYASSHTGHLKTHLKMHSGEKSNTCNQCDYASSHAGDLRKHLKTHSGEKLHKCNQCEYVSSQAGNLGRHLKTHSGEKSNKCNQCDYACLIQAVWEHIWKPTVEKTMYQFNFKQFEITE